MISCIFADESISCGSYPTNAMLVWFLSDIKSAVGLALVFLSRDKYLGDGDTDRSGSLHDGRAMSRTMFFPFWW